MNTRKHNHYFKDVSHLSEIDVYRVLQLFNVDDQALGHAIKKLLCAGQRGAGKDHRKDIQEAIDTLQRRLEMQDEDEAPLRNLVEPGLKTVGPDHDGWIPWDGRGRPVDLDSRVDVKTRIGRVHENMLASGIDWAWRESAADVVAYRRLARII